MNAHLKSFRCHREPKLTYHDICDIDDFNKIPETKGAYIIISHKQKFIYPNGKSRVIYIGKSRNLRRRIRTHSRIISKVKNLTKKEKKSNWYKRKYQYSAIFGAKVFIFTTRGAQDEQNLESRLMTDFDNRYFSIPVGNGVISYAKQ